MRRLGTKDGTSPTDSITATAKEILGAQKKDMAMNILVLALNDLDLTCSVTPTFLDALCTGRLWSKKEFEPSGFSLYGCPTCLDGTRLEDVDLFSLLYKEQSGGDLSKSQRELLESETVIIATTVTTLLKLLKNFHGICIIFVGKQALIIITLYVANWSNFVKDHEDRLAGIQRRLDPHLPAKIHFYIAIVVDDYVRQARFKLPDERQLVTSIVQRDILQNNHNLSAPLPAS